MLELFMAIFMALQVDRYVSDHEQKQECSMNDVEISTTAIEPIALNMNFDADTYFKIHQIRF